MSRHVARSVLSSVVVAVLALSLSSTAQATTRLPVGSPITGSATGFTFHYPYGIAVDETSGNVFVNDGGTGASSVAIFGPEGGIPEGVASPYKITGVAFALEPSQAVVDNVASSPSKGVLYVTDVLRSKLKKYVLNPATQKYEAAGELIPTGEDTKLDETTGVTIDAEGNVYAVDYSNSAVVKFGPTGSTLARYAPIVSPANLAVDSANDLFVAQFHNDANGGRFDKYLSDGAGGLQKPLVPVPVEKGLQPLGDGVAVDRATNQLFVGLTDRVIQLNATTLAKEGEFGVGLLEKATGIAVNEKTNRVYVADAGTTKRVIVFGAEVPTPIATTLPASGIGGGAATLNGTVNPTGTAVSACQFEYLSHADFQANEPKQGGPAAGKFSGPNAPTVKPCEGSLPADSADHPVTAALTGLTSGVTYHFRVKAANANGPYTSPEKTFVVSDSPLTTKPATEVKETTATLNGSINPNGEAVTECKFEYGTTEAYGSSVPCKESIPADESTHSASADLSGLAPGTTYHFRLAATIGGTPATGMDEAFATAVAVKTEPATSVGATKATLNGSLNPNGAAVTECKFEYGTSDNYGSSVPCKESIPADESTHAVSADISGLASGNTTYHFRLVVVVGGSSAKGGDLTFVAPATVITLPATEVGAGGATLNGEVNPQGEPLSECAFEYGTTTSYGQTAPCVPDPGGIGSGSSFVPVSANVSLNAGTTYHFRLRATNAEGTLFGKDKVVLTLGPSILDTWSEGVLRTEATLAAQVNPQGAATTYRFEYGTTPAYGNSTPELAVGSDSAVHTVHRALEGLEPDTTYHYRAIATSAAGTNEGPDRTFTTYPIFSAETECANQALRTGASANLPDCRAYEMVSPLDKEGSDITNQTVQAQNRSAASGGKLVYGSTRSFGDAASSPVNSQYIAARGSEGWESHGISPPRTTLITGQAEIGIYREYFYFSEDLCQGWLVPQGEPPLAEGAIPEHLNLYRRSDQLCGPESFEALSTAAPNRPGAYLALPYVVKPQAFSADGQTVAFLANDTLAGTGAPPQEQACMEPPYPCVEKAYVKGPGIPPRYACILPGGEAWTGECKVGYLQSTTQNLSHALSDDGKRLFWSAENLKSGLRSIYLRENPLAEGAECAGPSSPCTIAVSEEAEEMEGTGESIYLTAAADGSVAFFLAGSALYEFRVDGEETHKIADDVPHPLVSWGKTPAGGKRIFGMDDFFGASEDGSRVYFASTEVLTPGETNGEGDEPEPGQPNLYLYEAGEGGGTYTYVATLFGKSANDNDGPVGASVNADGSVLSFVSKAPLITGYDNTDVTSPAPCGDKEGKGICDSQVFVYDATANGGDGQLTCVSCRASGARPEGFGDLPPVEPGDRANLNDPLQPLRTLFAGGNRLFFESSDALLPRDTNGRVDVYQWERVGTGGCEEADSTFSTSAVGCVELISTGQGGEDAQFIEASASGDDVFFATTESLVPQDYGLRDIYDARVQGGFPQPPAPPAACEGEACQSPPEAPNDPTPASESFQGAGNVVAEPSKPNTRCAKGKVKRRGKCVAKKKHRKHKAVKRAKHERGAGR